MSVNLIPYKRPMFEGATLEDMRKSYEGMEQLLELQRKQKSSSDKYPFMTKESMEGFRDNDVEAVYYDVNRHDFVAITHNADNEETTDEITRDIYYIILKQVELPECFLSVYPPESLIYGTFIDYENLRSGKYEKIYDFVNGWEC